MVLISPLLPSSNFLLYDQALHCPTPWNRMYPSVSRRAQHTWFERPLGSSSSPRASSRRCICICPMRRDTFSRYPIRRTADVQCIATTDLEVKSPWLRSILELGFLSTHFVQGVQLQMVSASASLELESNGMPMANQSFERFAKNKQRTSSNSSSVGFALSFLLSVAACLNLAD